MKNDLIHMMTETFEGHAQETENGIEYWLARDLQHLLSYAEWRNFLNVVSKAKTACEVSGHDLDFLVQYFKSLSYIKYNSGGAQPKLNQAVCKTIPLMLPSPPEQQKIANCLSSIDELITAHAQKLDTLKTHKKWLMQQIFPSADEVKG